MRTNRRWIALAVGAVFGILCAVATAGRAALDHEQSAWVSAAMVAFFGVGCAVQSVKSYRHRPRRRPF